MAIPRKGSRKIEVEGVLYRWSIRSKLTSSQANEWTNLKAAVELYQSPRSTLSIEFNVPRSDSWLSSSRVEISPKYIALAISKAIGEGWVPSEGTSVFVVEQEVL